jgi:nucleoside-diphosphate-sugar epimerase
MIDEINTPILVTGAGGFLGARVMGILLNRGFQDIPCLIRPTSDISRLEEVIKGHNGRGQAEVIMGNMHSREDCSLVAKDTTGIYHLAARTGTRAFLDAYLNSVITTRNFLEATLGQKCLHRFVNVSSFAACMNWNRPRRRIHDKSCPVERPPETRPEACCFGKVNQDESVVEYVKRHSVPFVILRPGNIFSPGKSLIPGRVGIDSFGIYLDFGGSNQVRLIFVGNYAEAISIAGFVPRIDGESVISTSTRRTSGDSSLSMCRMQSAICSVAPWKCIRNGRRASRPLYMPTGSGKRLGRKRIQQRTAQRCAWLVALSAHGQGPGMVFRQPRIMRRTQVPQYKNSRRRRCRE